MKILKINLMKKKFNDIKKDFFEMKLINKTKTTINVIKNIIKL